MPCRKGSRGKKKGWKNEPYRHGLSSKGVKSSPLPPSHMKEMMKDEDQGHDHYLEMAKHIRETHPEYAEVFEMMAREESKHYLLLDQMKEGKDVDYRTFVNETSKHVIDELEDHNVITGFQAERVRGMVKSEIKKMPKEKLMAKGIATSLVTAFLTPLFGEVGTSVGEGLFGRQTPSGQPVPREAEKGLRKAESNYPRPDGKKFPVSHKKIIKEG